MSDTALYTQLTNAIAAHGAWKFKLRMAVNKPGGNDLTQKAGDYHNCDFGRWLGTLSAETRAEPEARDTIALHAAFHQAAQRAAQCIAQGKTDTALSMLDGEVNEVSKKLNAAVARWKMKARA
jgi:hypothetical protein